MTTKGMKFKRSETLKKALRQRSECSINIQQIKDGEILKSYPSMKEAARQTGIPQSNISMAANGIIETAGGYMWKKNSIPKNLPYERSNKTIKKLSESLKDYYKENSKKSKENN